MTRRLARELVVHLLFAWNFGAEQKNLTREYLSEERFEDLAGESEVYTSLPGKAQSEYVISAVNGVIDHLPELNTYVDKYSVGWDVGRITKVSKCIMQLSMYEMLYMGIPVKVSVNEAVELAKKYDSEASASFINGVLASFIKAEMAE